jgi:hypothetical protein
VNALGEFASLPQRISLPQTGPSSSPNLENLIDNQDYSFVTKPCDHYNNPNPILRAIPNPYPPNNASRRLGIPHAYDTHNGSMPKKSVFYDATSEQKLRELFVEALITARLKNNSWQYERAETIDEFGGTSNVLRCVLSIEVGMNIGDKYSFKTDKYSPTKRYKLVASSLNEKLPPTLVTMYPY